MADLCVWFMKNYAQTKKNVCQRESDLESYVGGLVTLFLHIIIIIILGVVLWVIENYEHKTICSIHFKAFLYFRLKTIEWLDTMLY